MPKSLLPLALFLVPLLTACPELDEINNSLNGSPTPTTNSSNRATVTAKLYDVGDCDRVRPELCTPEEYGLYYTDNTYSRVSKVTYEKAKIGDPK